jgi:hypothetical protein
VDNPSPWSFHLKIKSSVLTNGATALLEQRSLKLQNRAADIVRQVQFDPHCGKQALLEAILHYQQKSGSIDKHAPVTFLSGEECVAVTGQDGKFRVSLYKVLL